MKSVILQFVFIGLKTYIQYCFWNVYKLYKSCDYVNIQSIAMIALQNKTIYDHIRKKRRYNKFFVTIEYNTRPIMLCDFERDIFRVTDYQIIIDGTVLTPIHKLQIDKDIIKV